MACSMPLFVDDTALFVNLFVFEEDVVAPVVKNEEAGVDDGFANQWR